MSDQAPIRVVSVDDHPLLREGIAAVIDNQPDMLMAAQAATGCEAIEMFRQHRPDVTLMDLRLPDMSGIDALIAIRAEFPEARVIMLTTFEGDVEIQRALKAGARGYLLKSTPPPELVEIVRHMHAGKKGIPQQIPAINGLRPRRTNTTIVGAKDSEHWGFAEAVATVTLALRSRSTKR